MATTIDNLRERSLDVGASLTAKMQELQLKIVEADKDLESEESRVDTLRAWLRGFMDGEKEPNDEFRSKQAELVKTLNEVSELGSVRRILNVALAKAMKPFREAIQ